MKPILPIILIWITAVALTVHAAEPGGITFADANKHFEEGNAKALKNPAEAQILYEQAILKYQWLVDQGETDSPELFTNLGNACFFSGDHGRAVFQYQRALRLEPLQDEARHNLEYVRGLTVDELPETATQEVIHAVTFWHRWPFALRAGLFGVAHLTFWGICGVLFYRRFRWQWVAVASSAGVALVFGASLLVSLKAWDNPVDGVVLEREVIARQGDGNIYDSAFDSALHAGTEFSLIEHRGDWYHVELLDGSTCWLPAQSVGMLGR